MQAVCAWFDLAYPVPPARNTTPRPRGSSQTQIAGVRNDGWSPASRQFRKFMDKRLVFGDRPKCDSGFIYPIVASLHVSGHSPAPRLTEAARQRAFAFGCFGGAASTFRS